MIKQMTTTGLSEWAALNAADRLGQYKLEKLTSAELEQTAVVEEIEG